MVRATARRFSIARSTRRLPISRAEASTVSSLHRHVRGVAGTSVKVWPAGIVLGRFLGTRNDLGGKRIVEFGCGTGAVGVMALKALVERQRRRVIDAILLPQSYCLLMAPQPR